MAIPFLFILVLSLIYLIYKRNIGGLLCLLTLFPDVIGMVLIRSGISGLAMITKYGLMLAVVYLARAQLGENVSNIWRSPVSKLFYALIVVMFLHNEVLVGGASAHVEIATFQLNIVLRILIPWILLMLCANDRNTITQYCKAVPWWGLFFMLVFIFLIGIAKENFDNRMSMTEETGINSISLSRYAAMTFCGTLVCLVMKCSKVMKYTYAGILMLSAFVLLLASQRGSVVGVGLAVVVALGFIMIKRRMFGQYIAVLFGIIILVFILLSYFDFQVFSRFEELKDYESMYRYADYGIAWKAYSENDYIWGLGSMGYSAYTNGFRQYPHSFILELMSEYGIVGLIFALTVLIYGIKLTIRVFKSNTSINPMMTIPMIWLALLCSALVSADFLHNAQFFLVTGMLVLTAQNVNTNDDVELLDDETESETVET